MNWVRRVEKDGVGYYVATTYDNMYIFNEQQTKWLPVKGVSQFNIKGMYPYIADSMSGTNDSEMYLDVLMLPGDSGSYPNAKSGYLRIKWTDI